MSNVKRENFNQIKMYYQCIMYYPVASSFFLNQEVSHDSPLKLTGINFYYILMTTSLKLTAQ